jgi:hypothetical protein
VAAEDAITLKLNCSEGPVWNKIAHAVPGRSAVSIRNRFLRIVKGEQPRLHEGKRKARTKAWRLCGLIEQDYGHVCSAMRCHLDLHE